MGNETQARLVCKDCGETLLSHMEFVAPDFVAALFEDMVKHHAKECSMRHLEIERTA